MDGACSTYGREKCIPDFSEDAWKKEPTFKT